MGASADPSFASIPRVDPLVAEVLGALGTPERPHYAAGVLLDAEDFFAEQLYHRARLARVLAALHGHGTVAGLRVAGVFRAVAAPAGQPVPPARLEIDVAPGAALDRLGRVIEVRRRQCLDLGRWWDAVTALPVDAAARQRLTSAVRPRAGNASDLRVCLDVWLRFVVCPHGQTPAFAAGPFNATDYQVPHRLADGFDLTLALSRLDGDSPVPPAPQSLALERRRVQLGVLADPTERQAAQRAWRVASVLDAWPQAADDLRLGLPRLAEHDDTGPADTVAEDRLRVLLARVQVPVTQADATAVPQIDHVRWQSLDAALTTATAAERTAVDDDAVREALRALRTAEADHPVDNAVRPLVFNPEVWRGRLAADVQGA